MIVNRYLTDMMVFLQTDLQEAWNNDQGQIILTLISMITIFRTLRGFSYFLMTAVVF